ncbi:GFA family protein [Gynuella sp.]|uniref:GFA family protein n=1 Tax=Gynuella sp. TaxID=2969146 RepID=UPI003D127E67
MTYTGRCFCGAFSYQCNADPVFQFNCHCRDCQQATGSAYAPLMFFNNDVMETNGTLTFYESIGGSGKKIRRGFCPRCGSLVLGKVEAVADRTSVLAGTLDNTSLYHPKANAFCSQASHWDHMDPALTRFSGKPKR